MGVSNFFETLDLICREDGRYDKKAYVFVRQALDFTVEEIANKKQERTNNHISGQELLEGIRLFTLQEFGPLAKTLFDLWGIHTTEDLGHIVFNMVNHGILGKSENDHIEDFYNGYNFDDVFVKPFIPQSMASPKKSKKKTA